MTTLLPERIDEFLEVINYFNSEKNHAHIEKMPLMVKSDSSGGHASFKIISRVEKIYGHDKRKHYPLETAAFYIIS